MTTVVDDVVDTVLDLISPSPAPVLGGGSPTPSPSPLIDLDPLLGPVLLDPLRP